METNQAAENLQVIRTLMERSALYRRALAPIMTFNGVVGVIGGVVGWQMQIYSARPFIMFWGGIAALALVGSFVLVRRQALRDSEPFWSPPTTRVAEAMTPSLFFGGFVAGLVFWANSRGLPQAILPPLWMALYGCSLHAAGFFMARGIKLFGWMFITLGCAKGSFLFADVIIRNSTPVESGHFIMGAAFGGLQLAYGIYLYLTEQRKNVA